MKIHLLAAGKGQAMHWGSERSQLNPQPAKPLGKSEKGKPYPDLTNRKGYAWSKLILKCQFAVVFHFFWQLVFVYDFFFLVLFFVVRSETRLEVASDAIYIFITNKFDAVTNAPMQIYF